MAGELVPLVMMPRYSCYSGADTFYTMPLDVTAYESVILNVWRSPLVGTTPTFGLTFQESTDASTDASWSTVTGVSAGVDPGADTETQYTGTLKKRWFRVKLVLGGTGPVSTCWAVGFLERRQP